MGIDSTSCGPIAAIVPAGVSVFETCGDLWDGHFPEEVAVVGEHAVERRRTEFATGRACARNALGALGERRVAIPAGVRGEPVWPPGVVGSITHTDGHRAAAAARLSELSAIGIDAEATRALGAGILASVSTALERLSLASFPRDARPDVVLFSAKEAVFKAWYSYAGVALSHTDVEVRLSRERRTFRVRPTGAQSFGGRGVDELMGRWAVGPTVATTAVLPALRPPERIDVS